MDYRLVTNYQNFQNKNSININCNLIDLGCILLQLPIMHR